jgi:hypothetical protein
MPTHIPCETVEVIGPSQRGPEKRLVNKDDLAVWLKKPGFRLASDPEPVKKKPEQVAPTHTESAGSAQGAQQPAKPAK